MYVDEISEFDAQIVTGNLVYLDLALFDIIRAQADQDGISPLLTTVDAIDSVLSAVNASYCTHRTIMVSPRKSWRASIVAGFSVATTRRSESSFRHLLILLLTRVVICSGLIDDEAVGARNTRQHLHIYFSLKRSRFLRPEDGRRDVVLARLGSSTAGVSHNIVS